MDSAEISIPSGSPSYVGPEELTASELAMVDWDGETGLADSPWMIDCIASASQEVELPSGDSDLLVDGSNPTYDGSIQALGIDQEVRVHSRGYPDVESRTATGLSPARQSNAGDLRKPNDGNHLSQPGPSLSALEPSRPRPRDANHVDPMFPWPPLLLQSPPRSLHPTSQSVIDFI